MKAKKFYMIKKTKTNKQMVSFSFPHFSPYFLPLYGRKIFDRIEHYSLKYVLLHFILSYPTPPYHTTQALMQRKEKMPSIVMENHENKC